MSADDQERHDTETTALLNERSAEDPILKFFRFSHLPDHLKAASRPFGDLALHIVITLPRNAERTVALRKLLEAKDAGVRTLVS